MFVLALIVALFVGALNPRPMPVRTDVSPMRQQPSPILQRALDARAFVDSVGVNIHTSFLDTAYVRADRVLAALRQLHVRHVRDGLDAPSGDPNARAWQLFYLNTLGSQGIRGDLILGRPPAAESDVDRYASTVATSLRGFVESVEGPNEYDLSGDPAWSSHLRDYQQRLYAAVRALPELQRIPVIGPSFGNPGDTSLAGDLSSVSDAANIHSYTGAGPPTPLSFERYIRDARTVWSSLPIVVTEAGYHNALLDSAGMSERAAAAYIPRLVLQDFRSGVVRTYLYELVDEKSDPLRLSRDEHFGLFRHSFSPKPAAIALARLLSLLDGPTPSAGARTLDYTLLGQTAGLEQLLLKRSDGSYALVLWQDASVWDPRLRRDLHPPTDTIGLELASPARIQQTNLLSRAAPALLTASGTQATIRIPAADTTVLVIRPETGSNGVGSASRAVSAPRRHGSQ